MNNSLTAGSRPGAGHRRNKSSTSVLKSIISSRSVKGKENRTPPPTASSNADQPLHTPIWAQFASNSNLHQPTHSTNKMPLNDRSVQREINLYTPPDYSPSKQRNFFDINQPALTKKDRPKSDHFPKSKSTNFLLETFSRSNASKNDKSTKTSKVPLKEEGVSARKPTKPLLTMARKGTRVMGLVAAFNNKTSPIEPEMDLIDVDAQFEAVLESRNIPENMRQNLRSLKTSVKANLIKGNDFDLSALSRPSSSKSAPGSMKDKEKQPNRPTHRRGISETDLQYETDDGNKTDKRGRTRSRTFTFTKNRSSSKKHKPEGSVSSKSVNLPKSPSLVSLASGKRGSYIGESSKQSVPEDFVSYLRAVQQPQKVEVGKVHRLRQILRNETVSWVETFIKLGGMVEIVELLHRIMRIEWREEHEDQLLHETLLCLKALCTTDTALQKLQEMEKTLFPALFAMIFDPEHKGPSEYTTRQIITNILLTHLTAAEKNTSSRAARAKDILSYLSDPVPPEEKRPLHFILDMRQSRPYKVWHREVSNVSREVFWIFLHHHNIVPLPQTGEFSSSSSSRPSTSSSSPPPPSKSLAHLQLSLTADEYYNRFFPQPRPPVPAAPYVGGVEWDATNYVASHLDLMNGLIASIPTREQRNSLRMEMRNSGWEKVMGGTLRTCKEKFYDCVHSGLRTWIAAAVADGHEVHDVRVADAMKAKRSHVKRSEKPPVIETPLLDLNLGLGELDCKKSEIKGWI